MADKKAKIEIGIDGVNEVVEGFQKVLSSATFLGVGLTTIVAGVKQLNDELRKLNGIQNDISRGETLQKQFELRDSVDLINRRSGGQLPISYLNSKLSNLSLTTGFKPEEVGKAALDLGDATGHYKEAAEATEFVAKHAKNLGITLQEAGAGAKIFTNVLKVPEKELGSFYTQLSESAKKAGISPLLLERQIVQNADNLKGYSFKTTEDRQRALDLQVEFNKRANPQRATEEYGKALGIIKGSQNQIQRFEFNHGKKFDIYDEDGNIRLEALGKLIDYIRKKAGGKPGVAEAMLTNLIGDRHGAKTLLGIADYSKLGKGGKAEYPPEPFTAGESPAVQSEITERAQEKYLREQGNKGLGIYKEGKVASAFIKAQEARGRILSRLPLDLRPQFEREYEHSTSFSGLAGAFDSSEGPHSEDDIVSVSARDVVNSEERVQELKEKGLEKEALEEQKKTNVLLDQLIQTLRPPDSHTRTPSAGAQ